MIINISASVSLMWQVFSPTTAPQGWLLMRRHNARKARKRGQCILLSIGCVSSPACCWCCNFTKSNIMMGLVLGSCGMRPLRWWMSMMSENIFTQASLLFLNLLRNVGLLAGGWAALSFYCRFVYGESSLYVHVIHNSSSQCWDDTVPSHHTSYTLSVLITQFHISSYIIHSGCLWPPLIAHSVYCSLMLTGLPISKWTTNNAHIYEQNRHAKNDDDTPITTLFSGNQLRPRGCVQQNIYSLQWVWREQKALDWHNSKSHYRLLWWEVWPVHCRNQALPETASHTIIITNSVLWLDGVIEWNTTYLERI